MIPKLDLKKKIVITSRLTWVNQRKYNQKNIFRWTFLKTSTSFWLRAEWNFPIKGMLSFSNCVIYNFLFSISDVLKLLQKDDRHVSKTKDLRLLFRSQPPIFGDYFHRQCNYWRHTGPRFGRGSGGIATCAQGSWNWIQVNLIKNLPL